MARNLEAHRKYNREYRKSLVGFKHKGQWVFDKIDPNDIKKLQAEIPDDDRDLTARTFGDPLPGRRAIDRRRSA